MTEGVGYDAAWRLLSAAQWCFKKGHHDRQKKKIHFLSLNKDNVVVGGHLMYQTPLVLQQSVPFFVLKYSLVTTEPSFLCSWTNTGLVWVPGVYLCFLWCLDPLVASTYTASKLFIFFNFITKPTTNSLRKNNLVHEGEKEPLLWYCKAGDTDDESCKQFSKGFVYENTKGLLTISVLCSSGLGFF